MKREILFRGKRVDNGEWVEGSLITYDGPRRDIYGYDDEDPEYMKHYLVLPDTVGQFIGLTDKNGTNIFEGDRLAKEEIDWEESKRIGYEQPKPYHRTKEDVATMDRFPCFWLQNEDFGYEGEDLEMPGDWVVIGNIHDKP